MSRLVCKLWCIWTFCITVFLRQQELFSYPKYFLDSFAMLIIWSIKGLEIMKIIHYNMVTCSNCRLFFLFIFWPKVQSTKTFYYNDWRSWLCLLLVNQMIFLIINSVIYDMSVWKKCATQFSESRWHLQMSYFLWQIAPNQIYKFYREKREKQQIGQITHFNSCW